MQTTGLEVSGYDMRANTSVTMGDPDCSHHVAPSRMCVNTAGGFGFLRRRDIMAVPAVSPAPRSRHFPNAPDRNRCCAVGGGCDRFRRSGPETSCCAGRPGRLRSANVAKAGSSRTREPREAPSLTDACTCSRRPEHTVHRHTTDHDPWRMRLLPCTM